MNPEDFIVFIVDDVRRREALSALLASRGTRHQRGHAPDPSQQDHAEDGGGLARRSGEDRRETSDTRHSLKTSRKHLNAPWKVHSGRRR